MNLAIPWVLVGVLTFALALLLRSRARRATRFAEKLADVDRQNAQRLEAIHAAHEEQVRDTDSAHSAALTLLDARRSEAVDDAQLARARFASTWETDVVSHRLIADSCARVRLSGVLATNVVFAVVERERCFMAQIDHVLLTSRGAFIFENKYWRGLVFDGIRPSTVHKAFGAFLSDDDVEGPLAIQITAEDRTGKVMVRTYTASDAPVIQVRNQARRLSEHVSQTLETSPWFQTVVLYSYPDVMVFGPTEQHTASSGVSTVVVHGPHALAGVLVDLRRRHQSPISRAEMDDLAALFLANGAHMERVGPSATA
jgi:hypothetical protein